MSSTTLERRRSVRPTITATHAPRAPREPLAPVVPLAQPQVVPVAPVTIVATGEAAPDPVDVWGIDSFPASDPPSNW
jgi:hypothetical protein